MKPVCTFLPWTGRAKFAFLLGLVLGTGCKTIPPLPPADLSAPGWHVQTGQAIWKPGAHRPELAGDLIVATNSDGSAFIQFTKDPFALVTAQNSPDRWQINFVSGRRSWRGRGSPPLSFPWFQLPAALRGENPNEPWKFSLTGNVWRLEHPRRGEWLEGQFIQ